MSRLRTWLISCAMTPCSSSRSSFSSSPVVTAIEACFGSRPVAKALGAVSGMTWTRGIGAPLARRISSTTFISWRRLSGGLARSISCASLAASTSRSPPKYEVAARMAAMKIANTMPYHS